MRSLTQIVRDFEIAKESLKDQNKEVLAQLRDAISEELNRRDREEGVEDMLPEEFALSRIDAVRAYRIRTGKQLRAAIDAYSKMSRQRE